MQETLNTFTKIVRNLDPQKRENLQGEITRVNNALKEAAHLMQCIAEAAQKAGIYNGQVNLTTPHLKMLLDDMASSCAPDRVAQGGASNKGLPSDFCELISSALTPGVDQYSRPRG